MPEGQFVKGVAKLLMGVAAVFAVSLLRSIEHCFWQSWIMASSTKRRLERHCSGSVNSNPLTSLVASILQPEELGMAVSQDSCTGKMQSIVTRYEPLRTAVSLAQFINGKDQYFRSHNLWSVEWANNAPTGSHSPANDHNVSIDPFSVFVGQLNADNITKEAMLERFGKYGNIVDCNLVIKPGKFGEC